VKLTLYGETTLNREVRAFHDFACSGYPAALRYSDIDLPKRATQDALRRIAQAELLDKAAREYLSMLLENGDWYYALTPPCRDETIDCGWHHHCRESIALPTNFRGLTCPVYSTHGYHTVAVSGSTAALDTLLATIHPCHFIRQIGRDDEWEYHVEQMDHDRLYELLPDVAEMTGFETIEPELGGPRPKADRYLLVLPRHAVWIARTEAEIEQSRVVFELHKSVALDAA